MEDPQVDLDVEDIASLAHTDQRLAEARSSAAVYAKFWEELPEDMPEELRATLLLNWQQSHMTWQAFMCEEDEYE